MKTRGNYTVSEIIKQDYRTAEIFRKNGINYCCTGGITLEQACLQVGLSFDEINKDLQRATRKISISNELPFETWKLSFLTDFITNTHQAYDTKKSKPLESKLINFYNSHRKEYPHFKNIIQVFRELQQIVFVKKTREVEVIFPYIKQLESIYLNEESYGSLFVKNLSKPILEMENENSGIIKKAEQLKIFSETFHTTMEVCIKIKVIYKELEEYYDNIIQYNYIESHYLIPRSIEIEKILLGQLAK